MDKTPMSIYVVEVSCSQQVGGAQENSLDTLVHFCAQMSPEEGLKLVNRVEDLLRDILPGALAPITESAESALRKIGKGNQLTLGVEPGASGNGE